jgi:beta-lactamase class D
VRAAVTFAGIDRRRAALAGTMRTLPVAIIVALTACSSKSQPPPPPTPSPTPSPATPTPTPPAPDPLAIIRAAWPDGCFTALDRGMVLTSDADRCALPRRPYSTFKIANALIAVDAGVLAGADSAMTWDKKAVPDQPDYLDVWRQPHTLRSGIAVSAVPYFRTLALTLGADRMRDGISRLHYGNEDISGDLSLFWLRGKLRISADQQRDFMAHLAAGTVASFAATAQATVRDVLLIDERNGATLRGKTGSGPIEDGNGGYLVWLVGWVERDARAIPFAAWLEDKTGGTMDDARARRDQRVRATLAALGWIDAPPPPT